MVELTDNITDDEIRAGLVERADEAIGIRERADTLEKEVQETQRELQEALKEVATWIELLDDSLVSLSRGDYFIGWVETEPDNWDMTIKREIPPEHIVLD